ncbi:unnamed protein product [Effrenium voratum]|nr:unnamed protein product [Effrenium voratum]
MSRGALSELFTSEYVDTLMILAKASSKLLAAQPVLAEAKAPCRIFGDLHGQMRDLLLLFAAFGFPGSREDMVDGVEMSYVFNGDFVDRGAHSLEVIGLLLALKVAMPHRVWLVRGNHEDRSMNARYGFLEECQDRLGETFGRKTHDLLQTAFDHLPLACLVGGKILCVHGGVGDGRWDLNDLRAVRRPLGQQELGEKKFRWVHNILWSDPIEDDRETHAQDSGPVFGVHESPRNTTAVLFGWDVTKTFCAKNGIAMVVRSHQSKKDGLGVDVMHDRMLIRVFSARDYEGQCNDGAVLLVRPLDPDDKGEDLRPPTLLVRAQVLASLGKAAAIRRSLRSEKAPRAGNGWTDAGGICDRMHRPAAAKAAWLGSQALASPKERGSQEVVTFTVRGANFSEQVPRRALTAEVSPVLLAMVEPQNSEELQRGEQDAQGRYLLEGPSRKDAFALLVECVRQGGFISAPDMARRVQELDLEARIEACRFVDYYLLPGRSKMQLTKELFGSLVGSEVFPREVLDLECLGLCRSEMIMDRAERIQLSNLHIKNLRLENSHVKRIEVTSCFLLDCDFSVTVTSSEVTISNSRLENVQLGVFAMITSVKESCQLLRCNLRVVEELFVSESELDSCTFRGSDEDRKDRQFISAVFQQSELHGDITFPFDKAVCEQTYFHGRLLRMTKGGASISLKRARLRTLPRIDSEGKINLSLEDCDVVESLTFQNMRLQLRGLHFRKPCDFLEVEFPDQICDIDFPRGCKFYNVRFKEGLQACVTNGCRFEYCNLGYGQDAVADCLMTQCHFQACRFPFLEDNSPVANIAGSNFIACRIQWSGPFAHEESFVINSHWLRKWNLAGCTVSDTAIG